MKKLKNFAKRFWKDESAQGATEYILLLVVVVGLILVFKEPLKQMVQGKLGDLQNSINQVRP